jgi:hypothetical protein
LRTSIKFPTKTNSFKLSNIKVKQTIEVPTAYHVSELVLLF